MGATRRWNQPWLGDVDVHSPWREEGSVLSARHVGRDPELDAIRAGARAFAVGAAPLPLYIFGARGSGKSHLLALARDVVEAVTPAADVLVTVVPEDLVAMRSAEHLHRVMLAGPETQAWKRWDDAHEVRPPARTRGHARDHAKQRHVVLFEGLDRQLFALRTQGRRELRRRMSDGPPTWVIATGMTLPTVLTSADEAFFGAFDPWPLEPLADEDGQKLLDDVAGESPHDLAWRGMRHTLLTLASGSPRMLVALGAARRAEPDRHASELLQRVVHTLTPQYRHQLRALSPQSQSIVTLLAAAPREVAPSQLAHHLGGSTTQMSVQARRLVEDGVLRHRSDGRQTWYRLADPLFRYWLEYRLATWDETRVGWMASLTAAIDRDRGGSATHTLSTHTASMPTPSQRVPAAWVRAHEELALAVRPAVHRGRAEGALAAAAKLRPHTGGLSRLVLLALRHDLGDLVDEQLHYPAADELAGLRALADFDRVLRVGERSPRDAFGDWLFSFADVHLDAPSVDALRLVLARAGHGRAWVLRSKERQTLLARPHLRGLFLMQGRLWDHPPLLSPSEVADALEPSPTDASELARIAVLIDHRDLLRRGVRALALRGQPLPRCPRPHVFDEETSDLLATAIAANLSNRGGTATTDGTPLRDDTVARDASTWLASLAHASDARFDKTASHLESARVDEYLHEVALASLYLHHPERFDVVRELITGAREPFDRAVQLAHQLGTLPSSGASADLHPELSAVSRVVGAAPVPALPLAAANGNQGGHHIAPDGTSS